MFYHQLLTLPALRAAGQLGLGDRWWEHRWHSLERRRGYRRRVDPLRSSRSTESDEIVREKSTVVALREIVLPPPIDSTALGVTGPTGSSSVPPLLWQLSDAEHKES